MRKGWLIGAGLAFAWGSPALAGLATQGVSMNGIPLQGIPLQGIPLQGIPLQGIPLQGIPLQGVPLQGISLSGSELKATMLLTTSGYTPSYRACAGGETGTTTRGCGWTSAGVGSCTPGTVFSVKTTGSCETGASDSMLRVCSGAFPCESGTANVLRASNNAYGAPNLCAATTSLTCPSSGLFHVMTADRDPARPIGFDVTASPVTAGATVAFPADAGVASARLCSGGNNPSNTGRNCGWALAGIGTCAPGAAVTIGTTGCTTQGTDSMLRICRDIGACDAGTARRLAFDDNVSTTNLCSSAAFTCPASGVFTALVADRVYDATRTLSYGLTRSGATFPVTATVRGLDMEGAHLVAQGKDAGGADVFTEIRVGKIEESYTFDFGDGVTPPTVHGDIKTYRFQYRPACAASGTCTDEWKDLCMDGGQPVDDNRAMLFSGSWNAQGAHVASSTTISPSCMNGVVSKCAVWGYKPWQQRREHHQACTRMARGDYCGTGTPHTVNGTRIHEWDKVGIQPEMTSGVPADFRFEGAWGPDGVLCLAAVRWIDQTSLEAIDRECGTNYTPVVRVCGGTTCRYQMASGPCVMQRVGHDFTGFDASTETSWPTVVRLANQSAANAELVEMPNETP